MPTATVTQVYPKGPTKSGKNGPGAVVFSDGVKLSTFSDADLGIAKGLIGQLADYTVETKGQYTNLGSVKAARNGTPVQPVQRPMPALGIPPSDEARALFADVLVSAIKDHAASIRELAVEYRKVAAGILSGPTAASTVATTATPAPTAVIDEAQKKLAAEVGEDAAEAMFAAVKKKHAKKPEALAAAAAELLRAHGIGEAA